MPEREELPPHREGGVGDSTPSQNHHFPDRAGTQDFQGVLGDVRGRQRVPVHQQHACDVQRDIAVADDHGTFGVEIEDPAGVIGMAVVPTHEIGGRVAAGKVLTGGDTERTTGRGTDRIDDGVVMRQ